MNEPLVAAAILAAVEGGILPPGKNVTSTVAFEFSSHHPMRRLFRRAGSSALQQAGMPAATDS